MRDQWKEFLYPKNLKFPTDFDKYAEKDYVAALENLEAALKLQPEDTEARMLISVCQLKIDNHKKAIENYTKLIKDHPESEDLYVGRAYNYIGLKK